jgi:hypothetical protein
MKIFLLEYWLTVLLASVLISMGYYLIWRLQPIAKVVDRKFSFRTVIPSAAAPAALSDLIRQNPVLVTQLRYIAPETGVAVFITPLTLDSYGCYHRLRHDAGTWTAETRGVSPFQYRRSVRAAHERFVAIATLALAP